MVNKWTIGALVWLLSLAGVAWGTWDYCTARAHSRELAAVQQAIKTANAENEQNREAEKAAQEAINHATQKQLDEARARAVSLADELERLRNRPSRRPSSTTAAGSGPDCSGTTGAQLSREDAGFLIREATRADELRSAMTACYAYADTVSKPDSQSR